MRSTLRDRHAERLGQFPVLHGRPDLSPERAVLQHGAEPRQAGDRQDDGEELPVRPGVAEHRDAAAHPRRGLHRVALGAEEVPGELLQDQGHTDGGQERVERTFVHPLDQRDLEQQAHEPGDEERDGDGHERRDADAGDHLLGDVRHVGARHQELTVRHVDDAHLPEGQGQAERREQQDGACCRAGEEGGREILHPCAFRESCRGVSASQGCRARAHAQTRHPWTDVGQIDLTPLPGPTSRNPRGTGPARWAPRSPRRCRTGCRR